MAGQESRAHGRQALVCCFGSCLPAFQIHLPGVRPEKIAPGNGILVDEYSGRAYLLPMQTIERETEIRNSIAEGRNILRAGMFNGRKLTTKELWSVRLSVENALHKLGESKISGKFLGVTIQDVTPAGY
jgi:hypothetical protein